MTKTVNEEVLEFFQSFLAGSESQDFRPWAREVYQKLYRASAEPKAPQCDCDDPCPYCCMKADGRSHPCLCACHGI